MPEQNSEGQIPAAPKSRSRLDFIDALRGFACAWVLLFHSYNSSYQFTGSNYAFTQVLVGFVKLGYVGVHLFLVLSGFCLLYPLLLRHGSIHDVQLNFKDFMQRRMWRLLPPYFCALGIFTALQFSPWFQNTLSGLTGLYDILLHVTMLHNLRNDTIESISPSFWSLALESQLYLIFPLILFAAQRRGMRSVLLTMLLLTAAWQTWIAFTFGVSSYTPTVSTLFRALPGRCFEFAAGMTAAMFVANPRPKQTLWAVALSVPLLIPVVWYSLGRSIYGVLVDQAWGVIFACILVASASLPAKWFTARSPLLASVRLGGFSYSVYLIHQPLLRLMNSDSLGLPLSGTQRLLLALGRIILVIGVGYLFYLIVEQPFLLWNKRKRSSSGRTVLTRT